MLQVLCQILQTESLVDVQSWLVSASDSGKHLYYIVQSAMNGYLIILSDEIDKEKVKQLIDQAMKGLEQSGRIENDSAAQNAAMSSFENKTSTINEIENHLSK